MDADGTAVIIELKRGAHKLQLLQALTYAALIADWTPGRLTSERARFSGKSENEAEEEIDEYLNEGSSTLNASQRVILLAEDYDFEVLATAKWLTERYDVGIACWRAQLAADTSAEYLSLSCIYPPPELAKVARSRRTPRTERPPRWFDWDEALSAITNPAVVQFYRPRLKENWPSRLRRRMLIFEVANRRRFIMSARAKHVYVWQRGRFDGDEDFWRSRLGPNCRLDAVANGRALRFFLSTADEFESFWNSYREDMPGKTFHHEPPLDAEVDEDSEG